MYDGKQVGSVGYAELRVEDGVTRFIESAAVPADAQRVGTTWRYVNKKGGPDRRFKDNRELPVMQYGEVRLSSASGLREEIQVSRAEVAGEVRRAMEGMRGVQARTARSVRQKA